MDTLIKHIKCTYARTSYSVYIVVIKYNMSEGHIRKYEVVLI